ncbi:MAG: hypothetical protein E6I88_14560 [Chloroflexi bacterium]|nr:MAG: hypothetical protein E6I88_14560 [Chloroflexota bacterium]
MSKRLLSMLAAVLLIPAFGSSQAFALDLQAVSLSVSVGSDVDTVPLALDPDTLAGLQEANTALNTRSVGLPPLSAALAIADPTLLLNDPAGGNHSFVHGSGTISNGAYDNSISVSAHSMPNGSPTLAKGHLRQSVTGTINGSYEATITCLFVVGNTATVSGRITEASGYYAPLGVPYQWTIVTFSDNDPTGIDGFDNTGAQYSTTQPDCKSVSGTIPITEGAYEVHEVPLS